MSDRHLPVRPDLDQLKHQAKDLLRALRRGDPAAVADFETHRRERAGPDSMKLADAQLVLARSYSVASWPRLVLACRIIDAIWRDDVVTVRELVVRHPRLLQENARGTERCNWGPPMTYAANLGRNRIISMLRELGATDLQGALDRAVLQSRIETARMLYAMGARPPRGAAMGPAESLSGIGLGWLLELGAGISDDTGDWRPPVAMVLETYSRNPAGKHLCLELMARNGIALPDTAPMAVHRGRIDLLERHLDRDPGLLTRTFRHGEIFPPELGCHADETLALHGTPLAGATLLHLCVDYDEVDIARWLIGQGMNVNVTAAVDADGFGGHTPLFACVVSYAWNLGVRKDDAFARLLLDHGADPNARASLRKRLRFTAHETMYEYRDVTPLSWGERFHAQPFVSRPAMQIIAERGGHV